MPEPLDTIRHVNRDLSTMTLEELKRARAALDKFSGSKKLDVREARRKVGAKIDALEGRTVSRVPSAAPTLTSSGSGAAATTGGKSPGSSVVGVIVVLVIAGFIVHGCSGGGSGSGSGGSSTDDTARQVAAFEACKDAISAQLKAPSTADFQSVFGAHMSLSGSSVTVSSYVDAQNSFGAKIRNEWTCTADVDNSSNVSNVQATLLG